MLRRDSCLIGSLAENRVNLEISKESSKGPQPWHFALGSVESRAAARTKLARWYDDYEGVTLIMSIPRPDTDTSRVSFGPWTKLQDGTLLRIVYAPNVWLKPDEAIPMCPDCGTLFRKTREYPGMVGYAANCLDKHDPDRVSQVSRAKLRT